MTVFSELFRINWAPRQALAQADIRSALGALTVLGVLYALLYHQLAVAGSQPSMIRALPTQPESYYRAASYFVLPTLFGLWGLLSITTSLLCRTPFQAVAQPMGLAFGSALLIGLVLPDLLAFNLAGHGAMVWMVRITGPLSFILLVHRGWLALAVAAPKTGSKRRALALIGGIIALGIPATLLLR